MKIIEMTTKSKFEYKNIMFLHDLKRSISNND